MRWPSQEKLSCRRSMATCPAIRTSTAAPPAAVRRFPNDFDGIIAGAAANPKTGLDAWRMVMSLAMFKDAESLIPASKYPVIHQAVLDACDAVDGVRDGLIDNPQRCHFNPEVLRCK